MPRPRKDDTYRVLGLTLALCICLMGFVVCGIMAISPPDPFAICYTHTFQQAQNCMWGVQHEHGPAAPLKLLHRPLDN